MKISCYWKEGSLLLQERDLAPEEEDLLPLDAHDFLLPEQMYIQEHNTQETCNHLKLVEKFEGLGSHDLLFAL